MWHHELFVGVSSASPISPGLLRIVSADGQTFLSSTLIVTERPKENSVKIRGEKSPQFLLYPFCITLRLYDLSFVTPVQMSNLISTFQTNV
jgi:hypothetical protein